MPFLTPADLAPFADIPEAKASAMIADAEAMAALAAPCINETEFVSNTVLSGALVAILRGAILRWHDAGSGAVSQQVAGPFAQSLDTRTVRRAMFWPSEVKQLQDLCKTYSGSSADEVFTIDTAGGVTTTGHWAWCTLLMGGTYCSCGADIAGFPIYGA